ncbi:hypothetical protein MMC25_006692, partial [Agyrium rufum]|nr:hypothetical protein [Agyrium rufum]
MKSTVFALVAAFAAQKVAAHATFQELWVNGVDMITPPSNNPITDVTSNTLRCNVGGATGVAGKCTVNAGGTVTVEMHQQPGQRACGAESAIGGDHFGPVNVYMSKVSDSSTADGSSGFFKIFADTWSNSGANSDGRSDGWGTKDLNTCCGKMDVLIPADIPAGDYLLRAEVMALHVAGSPGGAQIYASCYQLTVTGGGSASPALVLFPGAYKATDPGVLINIYQSLTTYVNPGPTIYAGGSTKSAGSPCNVLSSVGSGSAPTSVAPPPKPTSAPVSSAPGKSTTLTSSPKATSTAAAPGGCTVAKYGQCGGIGFAGCTSILFDLFAIVAVDIHEVFHDNDFHNNDDDDDDDVYQTDDFLNDDDTYSDDFHIYDFENNDCVDHESSRPNGDVH